MYAIQSTVIIYSYIYIYIYLYTSFEIGMSFQTLVYRCPGQSRFFFWFEFSKEGKIKEKRYMYLLGPTG